MLLLPPPCLQEAGMISESTTKTSLVGEELGWQNTCLYLESYCYSSNCWSWLSGCCLVMVNVRNCAGGKRVLGWDCAVPVVPQHSSQHTSDAASAKWWNKLPLFPVKCLWYTHHGIVFVHLYLTITRAVQKTHRAWKWRAEPHLSSAAERWEEVGKHGKEENSFACACFDTEELFPVIWEGGGERTRCS